jgi:N-formylglutamate amidohydrolase
MPVRSFDRPVVRVLAASLVGIVVPFAALAYDPNDLVTSSPGSLPLILTAPHGGTETIGFISPRVNGVTGRDTGTSELVEKVAGVIEARTGKKPYVVIARFSRKYLDANRAPADAMESQAALPAYERYHGRIAEFVEEVRAKYPDGALLVDVHGQDQEPSTIFRGTRAGLTAKALVARHGAAALQGEKSVTGLLEAKGYRVVPSTTAESLREDRRYDGGYTVFTYGSQRPGGIDAIQLEFGRLYREQKASLADDLADALLEFMKTCGETR